MSNVIRGDNCHIFGCGPKQSETLGVVASLELSQLRLHDHNDVNRASYAKSIESKFWTDAAVLPFVAASSGTLIIRRREGRIQP